MIGQPHYRPVVMGAGRGTPPGPHGTLAARPPARTPICTCRRAYDSHPAHADACLPCASSATWHGRSVNGRTWIAFRGAPLDRLSAVVASSVDVDPTDTTIFCADEDKAYEYARPESGCDGPGLMYALHGGYLRRSFCTLSADASPEEIAEVRKIYPHKYCDPHCLYFSRLADQINTAYESAYGYWVPDNARDALLAIFLRGRKDEVVEALSALA